MGELIQDGDHAAAALLWAACRAETDVEAVRTALAGRPDPQTVIAAAIGHGIAALLQRALMKADSGDAFGEYSQRLESVAEVAELQGMLLVPWALASAVGPLSDADFEPVVLKGPAVAARYPTPGLRPMVDIDLLLPPDQHVDAVRALERAGWSVVRPKTSDRYDTMLWHPDVPRLALELHGHLETRRHRVNRFDEVNLWAHRVPIECMGTRTYGLPLALELVMLSQHAGKPFHGFSRLIWIADLGVVVTEQATIGQAVDWDFIHALALETDCLTVVSAALAMARRVGVSAPEDLFPLPNHGWRANLLDGLLELTWPLRCCGDETFALRFALTDLKLQRLRLALGSKYTLSEVPFLRWAIDIPRETLWRSGKWFDTVPRRSARVTRPDRQLV